MLLLLSIISDRSARGAEWQWSVPDGQARVFLWIPPKCDRMRGVVVANHNMIEQGILEHPVMRQTLAELNLGEVWVVPRLELEFDFNKGSGEHFQRVMDALADESGYDELKSVPVVPLGHSACATFPWNFAAWNPGRTLCVISVKGDAPQTNLTGYGRANVPWGDRTIDGVPGLMVMGEYEWGEARLAPALVFAEKHPAVPLSFLGDAGHGHFDYSDELVTFLATFIRKSAQQRLAPDGSLKPIDTRSGWRIDRWRRDQPPAAPAAPYSEYAGVARESFWCFGEEQALATEHHYAAARGELPQLLGFVGGDRTCAGEPAELPFTPSEDGVSFRLNATFLDSVSGNGGNPARWAGLPNGTPLGHATGGGAIRLSTIVGPIARVAGDVFTLRFNRAQSTGDGRNNDMWLLASHPGDDKYKSAVQQLLIRARPNSDGIAQTITFPPIPDQPVDVKSLKLAATSDAGLPVHYYVREGPAEVDGDTLEFTPIPPRAKLPIRVTVVAWQWGRSVDPKVRTAPTVERSFTVGSAR